MASLIFSITSSLFIISFNFFINQYAVDLLEIYDNNIKKLNEIIKSEDVIEKIFLYSYLRL